MFTVLYGLGWLFFVLISALGHPRIYSSVFGKPAASDDHHRKG